MIKPYCQVIPGFKIPVAKVPDGKLAAKVIADEAMGVNVVIKQDTDDVCSLYHPTKKRDRATGTGRTSCI